MNFAPGSVEKKYGSRLTCTSVLSLASLPRARGAHGHPTAVMTCAVADAFIVSGEHSSAYLPLNGRYERVVDFQP